MPQTVRICLWSGPRNVSTALMYAFAQRADTRAVDEPLYAHYLTATGVEHPGRAEVLCSQSADASEVFRDVILGPCDRPVLFLKSMGHHLYGIDRALLKGLINVFLTRDPEQMLPSLAVQVPEPTMLDAAFEMQTGLLDELEAAGESPAVIDSKELLDNPEAVLKEFCRLVAIPWDPAMLSWPAGPKPEDGVWAKHWYHNVHKSTGFLPFRKKTEPFPDRLRPLLEACRPHYEKLRARAITA